MGLGFQGPRLEGWVFQARGALWLILDAGLGVKTNMRKMGTCGTISRCLQRPSLRKDPRAKGLGFRAKRTRGRAAMRPEALKCNPTSAY